MRNPERTTKRERADARRRHRFACQRYGTAHVARARRNATDAVIRLCVALDLPPGAMLSGAAPGVNHWTASVEPSFVFEQWPAASRIRITGFGGTATFTGDELAVVLDTGDEREPLGPSACGHYEVTDIVPHMDALPMPDWAPTAREQYRDALYHPGPNLTALWEQFGEGPYDGEASA